MENINLYEKRIRSQNGEDGILDELFHRIGTVNKYFVEFGVQDGLECNSANLSLNHNWSGLMIDGNEDNYNKLRENFSQYPNVQTINKFITRENIVSIFNEMKVPQQFDLLSIDIDGNDYWIWQALSQYKPNIVVIEFNAHFPPPQKKVVKYNPNFCWRGNSYFGASLTSLCELAKQLGYLLIGTDHLGVNAFFIRNELISSTGFNELTPEKAYHPLAYGPYPHFEGPFVEV